MISGLEIKFFCRCILWDVDSYNVVSYVLFSGLNPEMINFPSNKPDRNCHKNNIITIVTIITIITIITMVSVNDDNES